MVISDFNIICIQQEKAKIYQKDGIGCDYIKNIDVSKGFYADKWQLLNSLKGIWYSFYPMEREEAGNYNDEFFDLELDENSNQIIFSDSFNKKKYILICEEKYMNLIKDIISFYLDASPVGYICLLFRIEGDENNAILGPLSKSEFFNKLQNKDLRFNIAYIISH